MNTPARVPVCVVTGLPGGDKHDFIRALLAARPADARWVLLDNDGGGIAADSAVPQLAQSVVSGCACCTGQVALQTGIVQLLRRTRPQRLIIAAAGVAEPVALERALRQADLARGIHVDHRLCVTAPELPDALSSSARDLLQQQMNAADHVVCRDATAAAALRGGAATSVLQFDAAVRLVLASPIPVSSESSRRIDS